MDLPDILLPAGVTRSSGRYGLYDVLCKVTEAVTIGELCAEFHRGRTVGDTPRTN